MCHTDPNKVDEEARDHFRKWFERTENEVKEGGGNRQDNKGREKRGIHG